MSDGIDKCTHQNIIIDEHEGTYICTSCALVIDNYYFQDSLKLQHDFKDKSNLFHELSDILELLKIPDFMVNIIQEFYKNHFDKKWSKNVFTSYAIYKCSYHHKIPLSIEDLCSVCNIKLRTFHKILTSYNDVFDIKPNILLEKVCKRLCLNYECYNQIVTKLPTSTFTGHRPRTIIAFCIYQHNINHNHKIPIKTICQASGISCISFKRYIKNELSCGITTSKR